MGCHDSLDVLSRCSRREVARNDSEWASARNASDAEAWRAIAAAIRVLVQNRGELIIRPAIAVDLRGRGCATELCSSRRRSIGVVDFVKIVLPFSLDVA